MLIGLVAFGQPTFKNEKKKATSSNMGKPKTLSEASKESYFRSFNSSHSVRAIQSDEGGNAQLTVYTSLAGLTEEIVQQITDEARDILKSKLNDRGYPVGTKNWDHLKELKQWQKKEAEAKSDDEKPRITMGGAWSDIPKSVKKPATINAAATDLAYPYIPAKVQTSEALIAMWTMKPAMKDPDKWLDDRLEVTVGTNVTYGNFKSGVMAGGIGQAAVNFSQELVTNLSMSVSFTNKKLKMGGLVFTSEVIYGNNDWGTVEETNNMDVDLSEIGGSAVKRVAYSVNIDPEKYKAAVLENMAAGMDAMLDEFESQMSEL